MPHQTMCTFRFQSTTITEKEVKAERKRESKEHCDFLRENGQMRLRKTEAALATMVRKKLAEGSINQEQTA